MSQLCYGCMNMTDSPACPYCGYSQGQNNSSHQLPVGTVLRDQYVVGRALGQGGFGITYLGLDRNLESLVAIKEFYPTSIVNRENSHSLQVRVNADYLARDFEQSKDRFLREARALARLRGVPEIVGVHSCFQENGTAYIIMEFVRGTELFRYVQLRGGRLSAQETLRILEPVVKALATVHKAGLVHRDISPDNIILHPTGGAKLLDFGAVRTVENPNAEGRLNRSTEAIVKHGFAPPEQYSNRGSLGPWTDEYAMCATICYCITGEIPPDAMARSMEEAEVHWDAIPGLLPNQRAALERGMSIRAKDRFPDMEDFYNVLYGVAPNVLPQTDLWKQPTAHTNPQAAPMEGTVSVPSQEPQPVPKAAAAPAPQPPADPAPVEMPETTVPAAPEQTAVQTREEVREDTGTIQPSARVEERPQVAEQFPDQPEKSKPRKEQKESGNGAVPGWVKIILTLVVLCAVIIPLLYSMGENWDQQLGVSADQTVQETQERTWDMNYMRADPFSALPVARDQITEVVFQDSMSGASDEIVDISRDEDGSVMAWCWGNVVFVGAEDGINGKYSCEGLFTNMISLEKVTFNGAFHTEQVTRMTGMFRGCTKLVSLDLRSLNVARVTDMKNMFSGCTALCYVHTDGWHTDNVKYMNNMFSSCTSLNTLDLNHWNVARVVDMDCMFSNCDVLREIHIDQWQVSSLEVARYMFSSCSRLDNVEIGQWNTVSLRDVTGMFSGCTSLKNINVSGWNVSSLTEFNNMFRGCEKLKDLDLSGWELPQGGFAGEFLCDGARINGRPWYRFFE